MPDIEPVVFEESIKPDINLSAINENVQPHKIETPDTLEKEIRVLEFSGYVTDGDHVLVVRDIENGKITKNIEINKGHQYSACNLTIEQIMKIYGHLNDIQSDKAFIKKQKDDKPYHFSSDDNLVVLSGGKEVILSDIPNYDNPELRQALEEKFGEIEKEFQKEDAHESDKPITNKLATLRKKVAHSIDKTLGTNLEEKKLVKPLKNIEKAVSDKLFGKVKE